MIPDAAFQLKGMLEITLNNARLFFSKQVGFFARYRKFVVPMNFRQIDRQGKLRFYIWNGLGDSSPISLNGTVIISDKDIDLSTSSDASTVPAGSPTTTIFNYILRAIGVYTQNIDLSGYKKINLLIAAASYVAPISITPFGNQSSSNLAKIIDGDLTTAGNIQNNVLMTSVGVVVDYGSPRNGIAAVTLGAQTGGTATTKLEVSLDNISYIAASGGLQNFRYIKWTLTGTSGVQSTSQDIDEIYDSSVFGGQAKISFEALEPSSGQWIEVISAAQIGAVSQGKSVSVQLGDTMALVNLNAILASDYAGIRMKLTIINGGMQTAVSIQRLA